LASSTKSGWISWRLLNNFLFYRVGLLAPRPTPKSEDHPLFAARDCLLNIFAATLHIWRPSPPSTIWGRAMKWWQWAHLTWIMYLYDSCNVIKYIFRYWHRIRDPYYTTRRHLSNKTKMKCGLKQRRYTSRYNYKCHWATTRIPRSHSLLGKVRMSVTILAPRIKGPS